MEGGPRGAIVSEDHCPGSSGGSVRCQMFVPVRHGEVSVYFSSLFKK